MAACKYCGIPIHFNPAFKSESGKFIPLQDENEPHNCPNNPYNAGGSGPGKSDPVDFLDMGYTIQKMDEKIDSLNKNMLKLILAVQTVQKRVEGQMPLPFGNMDREFNNSGKGTTDAELSD